MFVTVVRGLRCTAKRRAADTHYGVHQPLDALGIDRRTLLAQAHSHPPVTIERRFKVLFVNATHQFVKRQLERDISDN